MQESIELTNEELQEITNFYTRELSDTSTALSNPEDLRTALRSINIVADITLVKELFRRYHTYRSLPRSGGGGGTLLSRTASSFGGTSRPTSASRFNVPAIAIGYTSSGNNTNELSMGRGRTIASNSRLQQPPTARGAAKKKGAGGGVQRTASLRGVKRVDSFYASESPMASSRGDDAEGRDIIGVGHHACEGGSRMSCSSLVNICRAIKAFDHTSRRQKVMASLQARLIIGDRNDDSHIAHSSSSSQRFAVANANDTDALTEVDLREALSVLQPPPLPQDTYQKITSNRQRAKLIAAANSLTSQLAGTAGSSSFFSAKQDGNKKGIGADSPTNIRKFLGLPSPVKKNEIKVEEVKRLMKYVPFAEDMRGIRVTGTLNAPELVSDELSRNDVDVDEDGNNKSILSASASFEVTEEDQDLYIDIATVPEDQVVAALARKMNAIGRRRAAKETHKKKVLMQTIQTTLSNQSSSIGEEIALPSMTALNGDNAVRMFAVQKVLEGFLAGPEEDTPSPHNNEPSAQPNLPSRPTSASLSHSVVGAMKDSTTNATATVSTAPSTRLVAKDGLLEDPLLYATIPDEDLRAMVGMTDGAAGSTQATSPDKARKGAKSPKMVDCTASTSVPLVGAFISSQLIDKSYHKQLLMQQQAGLVKAATDHHISATSGSLTKSHASQREDLLEDTRLLRSLLYGYASDDEVEELQAVKAAVAARGAKEARLAAAAKKLKKVGSSANLLAPTAQNSAPSGDASLNTPIESTDPLEVALREVERKAAIQERLFLTPLKQQRLDTQMVAEHIAATAAEAAALMKRRETSKAKAASLTSRQLQDRETIRALRTRRRSMARIHFQRDGEAPREEGGSSGPVTVDEGSGGGAVTNWEDSGILMVTEVTGCGLSSAPTSFPRRRSSLGSTSSHPNTIASNVTHTPGTDGGGNTSLTKGANAMDSLGSQGGTSVPQNGSITALSNYTSPRKNTNLAASYIPPTAVFLTNEEVAALRRMSEEKARDEHPMYQALKGVIERYVEKQRQTEERAGLQTLAMEGKNIAAVTTPSRSLPRSSLPTSTPPNSANTSNQQVPSVFHQQSQHPVLSLSAHLLMTEDQRQAHSASLAATGKSPYTSPSALRSQFEATSNNLIPSSQSQNISVIPPRALSGAALTLNPSLALTNGSFTSDGSGSLFVSPLISPHGPPHGASVEATSSANKKGKKQFHPTAKMQKSLNKDVRAHSESDTAAQSSSLLNLPKEEEGSGVAESRQQQNKSRGGGGTGNASLVTLTSDMMPYGIIRPPFAGSFESNVQRWEKLRADEHTRVVTDDDNRRRNIEHTRRLEAAFEVCEMPYETFIYTPQLRRRPKKMPIFFHKSFAAHAHPLDAPRTSQATSLQNSTNTKSPGFSESFTPPNNSMLQNPSDQLNTSAITPRCAPTTPHRQVHAPHPSVMAKKLPYLTRSMAERQKDGPLLGRDHKVFAHPFIAIGVAKGTTKSDEDDNQNQRTMTNQEEASSSVTPSRAGSAGSQRNESTFISSANKGLGGPLLSDTFLNKRPSTSAHKSSEITPLRPASGKLDKPLVASSSSNTVVASSQSPVAEASRCIRAKGREDPKISHMSVEYARKGIINTTVPSIKQRAASASGIASSVGTRGGSGISYYGGHSLVPHQSKHVSAHSNGPVLSPPPNALTTVSIAVQSWNNINNDTMSAPLNHTAPVYTTSTPQDGLPTRPNTSLDFGRTASQQGTRSQPQQRSLSVSIPLGLASTSSGGVGATSLLLTQRDDSPRVSMHEGYNHQRGGDKDPHDRLRRSSVSLIEQHAQQLAALQQHQRATEKGSSKVVKATNPAHLKARSQSPLPASYYQKEQPKMNLATLQVGRGDLRRNVAGMIDQFLNNNREEKFLPWKT